MGARSARGSGVAGWLVHLMLAYALLIQGLVGAVAATRHAATIAVGIAPVPFCQNDPSRSGAPDPASGAHLPACCALGCAMGGQPLATGALAFILAAPARHEGTALLPPAIGGRADHTRLAFDARGPPDRA